MTDIKMLPLPPLHIAPSVEPVDYPNVAQALMDYARANVAHATAAKDAEIEKLRAEVDRLREEVRRQEELRKYWFNGCGVAQARAERLAEALRPLAGLDLRPDGFDKRPDDQTIYARDRTVITVGDVRRAQAALRDHDQEVSNG